MIQIIGYLMCAMLAVKLLEMATNAGLRDETGGLTVTLVAAQLLGWVTVLVFALWLTAQGGAFEAPAAPSPSISELEAQTACMERASPDLNAMLAC